MGYDWKYLAAGLGIVTAAFLLRIYHLGYQEFWVDEALSDHWARSALTDFGKGMALYYMLLRGWMEIAGNSEVSLRCMSAVFGTLFVAVTVWAGREFFSSKVGLWGGLIAALSPIHIYYSQEARTYALVTFALLVAYIALWRALQGGSWRRWALFSLLALLTVYSYFLAILGLMAGSLLVMGWPGKEGRLQRWLSYGGAMLPSVVLFVAWYLARILAARHQGSAWIYTTWEQTPPWLAIPKSLEIFSLGSQQGLAPIFLKQFDNLEFPPSLRMIGILIVLVIGICAMIPAARKQSVTAWVSRRQFFLLMLLFFPLLVMWLVSFVKPIYVVGRYDMIAFPVFPLVLGVGLARIQEVRNFGPYLAIGVAIVFFSVIGAKLRSYYDQRPYSMVSNRATARALHTFVKNDDVVIFTGLRGINTIYYLRRMGYEWKGRHCVNAIAGRQFGCRMFPQETEQRPGVHDTRRVLSSPDELRKDFEGLMSQLTPQASPWVVFHSFTISPKSAIVPPDAFSLVKELKGAGFRAPRLSSIPEALGISYFTKQTGTLKGK